MIRIEVSRLLGSERWDYRVLVEDQKPDVCVAVVVCEGKSFLSEESALLDAQRWVQRNREVCDA